MKNPSPIDYFNLSLRRAPEGKFKVVALNNNARKAWSYGVYDSFSSAKDVVDEVSDEGVRLYVHNDVGRIMYPSAK